ncbi:MAG: RagB/SusD family nutrient uptake outer membrane protein [Saprospiraceae bacterium]|nr:RagB/SusD family nutrient uptake outer membrane protein [Saprospiraceae bacterium]
MKYIFYLSFLIFSITFIPSCNIDDLANPNGPSLEGFVGTKSELQTLVTGSEDLLRQDVSFYYDVVSIIGREYYFFTGSDPRYTGEVLGKGNSTLDRAGFYGTRPYYGRYRNVKNLNLLIEVADKSTLITPAEAKGYKGYAKTMQAYELHLALNLQYKNGIRTDVKDPKNLGPFLSYENSLAEIAKLLDEANTDLQGATFSFTLSDAMKDFATASEFAKFNRALAARIALYQGNNDGALAKLADSFLDLNGDFNKGPARFYSLAGGDFPNNIYRQPDQADAIIVQQSNVSNLQSGDLRGSKFLQRTASLTLDGLSGTHDAFVFKSFEDYVALIRNEELILIYAEANITKNASESLKAINIIRNHHGLANYGGSTSAADLLLEVSNQRRYSLFGEGHRWVDMRRWGRLAELPKDRPDDDVWEQLPRPISEN